MPLNSEPVNGMIQGIRLQMPPKFGLGSCDRLTVPTSEVVALAQSASGLGFRVQGPGFSDSGLGFRVFR